MVKSWCSVNADNYLLLSKSLFGCTIMQSSETSMKQSCQCHTTIDILSYSPNYRRSIFTHSCITIFCWLAGMSHAQQDASWLLAQLDVVLIISRLDTVSEPQYY